VGVSKNSNFVYTKGFGYSDVENCVRALPHTVVRIASISKPITCLIGAKLWEQGTLDIDKPISEYLAPDGVPSLLYKGKPQTITTRQLMAHTAGIRHYKNEIDENCKASNPDHIHSSKSYKDTLCNEFYMNRNFKTTQDALQLFLKDELLFEPGKGYLYSTFGYTMLSAVLEKASKNTPFPRLLVELFRKLDMNETYLDVNDTIVPYRAKHYLRDSNKRLVNVPYVDVSYKYGGGGILSNVYDLCKLGNKLVGFYQDTNGQESSGGFLKASTMRQLVWSTQSKPERWAEYDKIFIMLLDLDFLNYGTR
jgi:serine beta-lactamase-like protein LACTB